MRGVKVELLVERESLGRGIERRVGCRAEEDGRLGQAGDEPMSQGRVRGGDAEEDRSFLSSLVRVSGTRRASIRRAVRVIVEFGEIVVVWKERPARLESCLRPGSASVFFVRTLVLLPFISRKDRAPGAFFVGEGTKRLEAAERHDAVRVKEVCQNSDVRLWCSATE